MNVDFINPFLEAVVKVSQTMAATTVTPAKPFLKEVSQPAIGDVTGIIGLTGPVSGSVALGFSEAAILHAVTNMFGESCKELNEEVTDAVGELTNMICGDARRLLAERGHVFQASIPTIVTGKAHTIIHTASGSVIVIPFTTDAGEALFVEVCFEAEK